METQLRQQIEQRHRAETDLLAVRDLCVKLDQQKESLMQQLSDKNNIKEHVNIYYLNILFLIFYTRQLFDFSLTGHFFNFHVVWSASVEAESRAEYYARTDD